MQHSLGKLNICTTSRKNCSAATIFSVGSPTGVNVPCGKSDECERWKLHSVDDSSAGAQSGIDAGMEVFYSALTRTINRSFTRKSPPLPTVAAACALEGTRLEYNAIIAPNFNAYTSVTLVWDKEHQVSMSKRLFPMNKLCRYSSCHPPLHS